MPLGEYSVTLLLRRRKGCFLNFNPGRGEYLVFSCPAGKSKPANWRPVPSLGCPLRASQLHFAASVFQRLPRELSLPFPEMAGRTSAVTRAQVSLYANHTAVVKTEKEKKEGEVTKVKILGSRSPVTVRSVLPTPWFTEHFPWAAGGKREAQNCPQRREPP